MTGQHASAATWISVHELEGIVNCQNSRDKDPPECNSARG